MDHGNCVSLSENEYVKIPDAIKTIGLLEEGIWRHDAKAASHYCMEEIQAVVDECNMVGLPVWSHAEGYEGAFKFM